MTIEFKIYGAELSPFSVKVRSYFRYKQIPHQWILRTSATEAEFQKYAKLPIVPVVATPDGQGLQDSTPIIETLEELFAEPSIHPTDADARFVSQLLEEFGDEWANKWMFHYRWARETDQLSGASRLARYMVLGANDDVHAGMAANVRERMTGRVWFVGASEQTAPQIEASFHETLDLLETHLSHRPYLFGGRPSFADFAMWGQVYNAALDPTPFSFIEMRGRVLEWVQRMLWPRAEGTFETWPELSQTLMPLLAQQVGALFVPWTLANAKAIQNGDEEFSVELRGQTWTQKPQKYHAKSLAALQQKYQRLADTETIDVILEEAGCAPLFRSQE